MYFKRRKIIVILSTIYLVLAAISWACVVFTKHGTFETPDTDYNPGYKRNILPGRHTTVSLKSIGEPDQDSYESASQIGWSKNSTVKLMYQYDSVKLAAEPKPRIEINRKFDSIENKWQKVDDKQVYLFSAFSDSRLPYSNPIIVILGFVHHTEHTGQLYCGFIYKDGSTKCTGLAFPTLLNPEAPDYELTGISFWAVQYICDTRGQFAVPELVTLGTSSDCMNGQHYSIKVYDTANMEAKSPQTTFGLCLSIFNQSDVKAVFDAFETNFFLGVQTVTLYRGMGIDDKVDKLLQSYVNDGRVEIINYTLPTILASQTHFYGQNLIINDCLYRNMHRVKYLVFSDLDELIVPRMHNNLSELITALHSHAGIYIFLNVFYCQKNPTQNVITPKKSYLPAFLTYTWKSAFAYPPDIRSKMIVDPRGVRRLGVHKAFELIPSYENTIVPPELGVLQHYRNNLNPVDLSQDFVSDDYVSKTFAASFIKFYNRRFSKLQQLL